MPGLSFDALFAERVCAPGTCPSPDRRLSISSIGSTSAGEGHMREFRPFIEAPASTVDRQFDDSRVSTPRSLRPAPRAGCSASLQVGERRLPSRLHQLTVARTVLGFPGEALPQGVPHSRASPKAA